MYTQKRPWVRIISFAIVSAFVGATAPAADDPTLTKDQIKQFLLNAEVIGSKESSKGTTHPTRLTLSNGTLTHDASYQGIDEHKESMKDGKWRNHLQLCGLLQVQHRRLHPFGNVGH